MNRQSARKDLAEGGSVEQIADFYDRTDTGDLPREDAGEEDEAVIEGADEMEQVSIRLPREDLERIKRRAKAAGVGHTIMIRMIVHAHLENPLTY
jgi:predicted DNA binding CopG/RHH family protein